MPEIRTPARTHAHIGIMDVLRGNWLNTLLIFVPVSILLEVLHAPALAVFLTSALAIVPLAGLIGKATEELSDRVGPALGGFLNATFGNATELIIAIFALRAGLFEVVKASISGSIIGNILLVLGVSMFVGGWGREKQHFNRTIAGASAAMLFLAVVALVLPAVFELTVIGKLVETSDVRIRYFSLLVAIVLILTYFASLVFSLKTHRAFFAVDLPEEPEIPRMRASNAGLLLFLATVVTAIEAEFLVGAIEAATKALHMTEFFVGVIVVAIIGNAAEHFSAVVFARKNKMELAMTISTSSSTQIALFVAPVLVFLSFLFHNPMTLIFNAFEVVGIACSVLILAFVSLDGESNWFEGVQLIAVYLILAIVFYFVR